MCRACLRAWKCLRCISLLSHSPPLLSSLITSVNMHGLSPAAEELESLDPKYSGLDSTEFG